MNLDDIFKQDQGDENLRALGRMLGILYTSLVDNGIPVDTACQMIEDYHWATFCCSSYREIGHFPPRS